MLFYYNVGVMRKEITLLGLEFKFMEINSWLNIIM